MEYTDEEKYNNYFKNKKISFKVELAHLINKYGEENEINTPDFILADYLIACLDAFELASRKKEKQVK